MKRVCLVSAQKEEMGAGLWKNFSRLEACFMLQWAAKFGTEFLRYQFLRTVHEQLTPVKPWDALSFCSQCTQLLLILPKNHFFFQAVSKKSSKPHPGANWEEWEALCRKFEHIQAYFPSLPLSSCPPPDCSMLWSMHSSKADVAEEAPSTQLVGSIRPSVLFVLFTLLSSVGRTLCCT